jgi:hypothetical protein
LQQRRNSPIAVTPILTGQRDDVLRQNELAHLYEVLDALAKNFGGKYPACSALGIEEAHWRRLGELANDAPLSQGRHRGWHVGRLQDATSEELNEARAIAKNMIQAYLKYLDR